MFALGSLLFMSVLTNYFIALFGDFEDGVINLWYEYFSALSGFC
jgi:hypothetical protein